MAELQHIQNTAARIVLGTQCLCYIRHKRSETGRDYVFTFVCVCVCVRLCALSPIGLNGWNAVLYSTRA